MLICPFCEFENSISQRSCERCGQPFQRWRVLTLPNAKAPDTPLAIAPEECYGSPPSLDPDGRYRLIGTPGADLGQTQPLIVVDAQPNADAPLQALQQAWLDTPDLDPAIHPLAIAVPAAAYPYLALQVDYFPAVPELHHAWQTPQHTILLLEDRTGWIPLTSAWSAIGDPLLRIQWLFETTLLWQALAPWQGQATLLDPQRLTLNENSLLCLTHLDQRPSDDALPLQALGQLWQHLTHLGHSALPLAVQTLTTALVDGTITEVAHLQDALAEAAQAYQDSPSDPQYQADAAPIAAAIADSDPAEPTVFSGCDSFDLDADLDSDLEDAFETQEILDEDNNGPVEAPTMVLPMKLAHLDDVGQSHVGQQRHHNEDWFFTHTQLHRMRGPQGNVLRAKGLYILCDGMGGHASGEVASRLAVRTLRDYLAECWGDRLPDQATLTDAVVAANQAIFDINQSNATSGVGRMGTTLVMVLVHNLTLAVVHVGDSRLYSYSKRLGLRQLTIDHEVGQREIHRGVEPALAYARPDAYQLTQALGPRGKEDINPSISYHELTEDSLLLLCSDGLSDNDLLERHDETHIAPMLSSRANLDSGVSQLVDLANEKNGHDNITAILVRVKLQPDLSSMGDDPG